jgi:DnaK suppressor protein
MNKFDLVKMRGQIIADLAKLQHTAETAMRAVRESAENIPNFLQDESGAAKGGSDLENSLSVHKHCTDQQQLLKNALLRMDRGDFGLCQKCGCEINPRRLEAMPGATCCIHCQAEVELKSVMRTRPLEITDYLKKWWAA